MKKWIKWLLLAIVIFLVACGIGITYLPTYGEIWSVDSFIYRWMFRSMPEPPGFLPKTDFITVHSFMATRSYFVDMDPAEVVDFFITKFPQSGWNLMIKKESELADVSRSASGEYLDLKKTTMLFAYRQWYWLSVEVSVQVNKEGKQVDPFPHVMMEISKDWTTPQ